jgi:phosphatidate cytidylyltransferase
LGPDELSEAGGGPGQVSGPEPSGSESASPQSTSPEFTSSESTSAEPGGPDHDGPGSVAADSGRLSLNGLDLQKTKASNEPKAPTSQFDGAEQPDTRPSNGPESQATRPLNGPEPQGTRPPNGPEPQGTRPPNGPEPQGTRPPNGPEPQGTRQVSGPESSDAQQVNGPELPGTRHANGGATPDVPRSRAGRNLPAAAAVGLGMGAVAIVTLFTVKFTFLIYMGAIVAVALWELTRALGGRGIRLPLPPVAVGGALMVALAYSNGERALVGTLGVTMIAVLAWRMVGGSDGYLRDVTAGMFALIYLALTASFVGLMLAAPDGARRTLVFLVLAACSDVGGYFVGSLIGRHPMVPAISPHKTWEGFGGSMLFCLVAGGLMLPLLLHGAAWQGICVGAGALVAATLGDLSESMIKRDLQIKDMGSVLPGHGGVLDRIDSLLITAPVVWLLLVVFLSR